MRREVIHINEDKCDGCGECVPFCAEGAIRIIDGKARLLSDRLCDGLGACLGHCPRDAIRIEVRDAAPFDEAAVAVHLGRETGGARAPRSVVHPPHAMGCPSAQIRSLSPPPAAGSEAPPPAESGPSELSHWPVQLHLVPPTAPFLQGSHLLLCATCVPVAMSNFQIGLLSGRTVVLACPKLDDQTGYFEKFTAMFADANLRSVTVARMEVPCCGGLVHLAAAARQAADSTVPVYEIIVGVNGEVIRRREITPAAA